MVLKYLHSVLWVTQVLRTVRSNSKLVAGADNDISIQAVDMSASNLQPESALPLVHLYKPIWHLAISLISTPALAIFVLHQPVDCIMAYNRPFDPDALPRYAFDPSSPLRDAAPQRTRHRSLG